MRFSNVQVIVRPVPPSAAHENGQSNLDDNGYRGLPVARATLSSTDGVSLNLQTGDVVEKVYQFDACIGPKESVPTGNVSRLLKQLFHGISVGLFAFANERTGEHVSFLVQSLQQLEALVEQQKKNVQVSLSGSLFGVSDSSCVDLLTYERKDRGDVEEMVQTWTELSPIDRLSTLTDIVQMGYSMPMVVLVRLLVRPFDKSLPSSMATLTLADLGALAAGSNQHLDRSISVWKANILTMDQAIISNPPAGNRSLSISSGSSSSSFLSFFLDEHFGGDAESLLLVNVPNNAPLRALSSQMQIVDAVRRIKNRPVPRLESREMLELGVLMQAHSRLEDEHRSVRHEMRVLQRNLKAADRKQQEMELASRRSQSDSVVERCEFKYQLNVLEMQRLDYAEKLRACEVNLAVMDHQRLILRAEMELKHLALSRMENSLRMANEERMRLEQTISERVGGLYHELEDAQSALQSVDREKAGLARDLKTSQEQVERLMSQISFLEHEKSRLEMNAQQQSGEDRTKLNRLYDELCEAKNSERQVSERLKNIQSDGSALQRTVSELEGKMSALRVENAALQARVDLLTAESKATGASVTASSPEVVNRTIRQMEDKWQTERSNLYSMISDLRCMVKERKMAADREEMERELLIQKAVNRSRLDDALAQSAQATVKQAVRKPISVAKSNANSAPSKKQSSRNSTPKKTAAAASVKSAGAAGSSGKSANAKISFAPDTFGDLFDQSSHFQDDDDDAVNPDSSASSARAVFGKNEKKSVASSSSAMPKTTKAKSATSNARIPSAAKKGSANNKVEAVDDVPMEKLEIPGTPPPKSPVKAAWKPASFVPSLKMPKSSAGGVGNLVLPGMSDNALDLSGASMSKRIKLPERMQAPVVASGSTASLKGSRRHVDQSAYSTIMDSFTMPS